MKKISILVIILFPIFLFASNSEQLFQEANKAYQAGDYRGAIDKYENLLGQGVFSAELYFNLGNSYYKEKNLGRARLNYERAWKLSPGPDLLHNLKAVKLQLRDQIDPLPEFFFARWWRHLRGAINNDVFSILGVIWLWLGLGGLSFWLLNPVRKWKRWGFFTGLSFLILACAFFLVAVLKADYLKDHPYAVILAEQVTLFDAPEKNSESRMELHEGTKIKLLEELSDWQLVQLPDGEEGWLENRVFEKI